MWIATLASLTRNDVSRSYCDNRRSKGPCLHGTIRAAEQGSRRLQSTVYRGVLSEVNFRLQWLESICLNPLYIVERKSYCDNRRAKGLRWRRTFRAAEQGSRRLPIHCMSWNAFGGYQYAPFGRQMMSLNPLYIVECFRSGSQGSLQKGEEVLIHCISWNAFGDCR